MAGKQTPPRTPFSSSNGGVRDSLNRGSLTLRAEHICEASPRVETLRFENASLYSQQPLSLLTIRELAVADVLQVRAPSAGIRVSRVRLGDLPISTGPPL